MGTLTLTTIGSRGLVVDVKPSALPEAGPGGVAIHLQLHDGPLIVTFTAAEAQTLADAVLAASSTR